MHTPGRSVCWQKHRKFWANKTTHKIQIFTLVDMNKASCSSLKEQFTTERLPNRRSQTTISSSPMIELQKRVSPILDFDKESLLWGRQIVPLEQEIQSLLDQEDIMFPNHHDIPKKQIRNSLRATNNNVMESSSDQHVESHRFVAAGAPAPTRRGGAAMSDRADSSRDTCYDYVSPIVPMSQHHSQDQKEEYFTNMQAPDQIVDGGNQPYGFMRASSNIDIYSSATRRYASYDFQDEQQAQDDITSTSMSVSRPTNSKKKKGAKGYILPLNFQPSPYSVIVGKGKESKNVIGNSRLRVLASNYLPQYGGATDNRQQKSEIVSTLIATVRNACPMGAFIRLGKDGRWYEVDESVAREKVGYTFRELLGDSYRSSSKAKVAMRTKQRTIRAQKQEKPGHKK